jgi:DNA repair ATPase RecN
MGAETAGKLLTKSSLFVVFADRQSGTGRQNLHHRAPLDLEGRKRELARIIGGANITETTLKSAEEMLKG